MKLSKLIPLLESMKEEHGDLEVRAGTPSTKSTPVTGVQIHADRSHTHNFIKLVSPDSAKGW